jgi:hypothetical protein
MHENIEMQRENRILIKKMQYLDRNFGPLNPFQIYQKEQKKVRPPSAESLNRGLRVK